MIYEQQCYLNVLVGADGKERADTVYSHTPLVFGDDGSPYSVEPERGEPQYFALGAIGFIDNGGQQRQWQFKVRLPGPTPREAFDALPDELMAGVEQAKKDVVAHLSRPPEIIVPNGHPPKNLRIQ